MIDLIIPSRGRPEEAHKAAMSAVENQIDSKTQVKVVIDDDDSRRDEYADYAANNTYGLVVVEASGRRGIVDPLNIAASLSAGTRGFDGPIYIGFMGDDHRVRTRAWDDLVLGHVPADVIYGDDKFQGINLPTAVFIRAYVVRRLGFYAPPTLQHLFVDNYWKALGERLGSLVYDPELVIEHLHPDVPDGMGGTKGEWDDLKRQLNSQEMYTNDRVSYMQYEMGGSIDRDARKVMSD